MFANLLGLNKRKSKSSVSVKVSDIESKILRCIEVDGISEFGIKQKYERLYPVRISTLAEILPRQKIDISKIILSLLEKGCITEGEDEIKKEKSGLFYLTHEGRKLINRGKK